VTIALGLLSRAARDADHEYYLLRLQNLEYVVDRCARLATRFAAAMRRAGLSAGHRLARAATGSMGRQL